MILRLSIVVAACAGTAATFLPWEVYGPVTIDGRVSGGWVSFGAFVVGAVLASTKPMWWIRVGLVLAGMVAIAAAATKIGQVGSIKKSLVMSLDPGSRREGALIHIGVGAWIVVGSSLALIFGGLLWRRGKPGAPTSLPRATLRS